VQSQPGVVAIAPVRHRSGLQRALGATCLSKIRSGSQLRPHRKTLECDDRRAHHVVLRAELGQDDVRRIPSRAHGVAQGGVADRDEQLIADSRDTATFATTGLAAALRYERMDDSFGSDRNWERLEAGVRRAISVGKYVTWLSLAGGTHLDSDLPFDRYYSLGGPRVLQAFQHDELRVAKYWVAESSFLRKLTTLSPIKNQAIYAGLGLQAAGLYDRLDVEGENDEVIYGGYLFLAGPTAIGTFTLGMGFAEGEANVWLSIGKPITSGTLLDDGLFR